MLAGALWGLLSWVPALLSHSYFELVGYRLGRPLTWLMPSWWAIRGVQTVGLTYRDPAWVYVTLLVIAGIVSGAAVALVLWWLVDRARPAAPRSNRLG